MLDVFFPPACVACDTVLPGPGFFCGHCELGVEETPVERCSVCAEPGRFVGQRCARCATERAFTQAFAPFEHDGAVAKAIHRFKYEDRADLARPLGELTARRSEDVLTSWGDVEVCPVPLHERRYRERGYDQATLLAKWVASTLGQPLRDDWLTRIKATERQVGQSESAREANVDGAFTASAAARGQRVVLIDDVYTTGATVSAAATVMRSAGATQVYVLTLARARRETAGH